MTIWRFNVGTLMPAVKKAIPVGELPSRSALREALISGLHALRM